MGGEGRAVTKESGHVIPISSLNKQANFQYSKVDFTKSWNKL